MVQIMACRLVGAKPLSEPMLEYCWFDPSKQTFVLSKMSYIYIQEIAFENVVREMVTISIRP